PPDGRSHRGAPHIARRETMMVQRVSNMRVVPAILAAVLSLVPLSAAAQRRVTPAGPFVKARAIECAFTTYGVASWNGLAARVLTGDDDVRFRVENLDLRRGAARVVSASATVEVTAMATETGLNVIEQTPIGNFILTTIFSAGGSADKYVAVHSRHLGDLTT